MTMPVGAVEAVYEEFLQQHSLASDTVLDNEAAPSTDTWARIVVRTTNRAQDTLGRQGTRRFRTTAAVVVQVYTPINRGVQDAMTLAKEAADIFEGRSLSGLDFGAAQIEEIGPQGRYHLVMVEVPFDYDETK